MAASGDGDNFSLKEVITAYRAEHQREHDQADAQMKQAAYTVDTRFRDSQASHEREHVGHVEAHAREHLLTNLALEKAEEGVSRRVEAVLGKIDDMNKAINDRLTKLEKDSAAQAGQRGGSAATISYIVLAIGALAGLIGLFTFFAGQG